MSQLTLPHFAVIAISAYLLGSLSFAIIVCKMALHKDIRDYGSGNAGLTNAYRTMGASKTLLVLLGDIAKGAAAVAIGALLGGPLGKLIAGVFVILGHMFPVYFGFRGGKGVLVGAVMLALFDWRIFLAALALFLIAVVFTRWISLGSVLGAASFPITMFVFYRDPVMVGIAFGMAAAVIIMHRANIGRMLRGEENKFSFQSKKTIESRTEEEEEQG
ncbi:glycerol-3-phosphate 1-O-acyltransferase PlsY [Agathobaculum sp.]|uniref:glycerol-3-phosphate 1-O-acyltransferase PlsY n=1 Tax=Agathobaculum sp. TaxID=2048138 RepID=UPI002A835142|nr:glycerol-3-phosphate 1-O-acyltransferase PlsY [Agathobaculum sp.]MDY3618491.1 glycerol-3-phosphate 1-O-acyltransferase PlsY [Agathobaculum sp.]